jgi:cytochrome P450
MTATTIGEPTSMKPSRFTEASRPPLVKSVPFVGPVRQFLGDVLPFLMESRATYGDAFRLRMFNLEMTCLCGSDAIELLEAGSPLRVSKSMHVLDGELGSCLPSTFDGPQHKMFRKAHLEFMTASLESKRRDDVQSRLAEHTSEWRAGDRVDVLHEAQVQTVDVLSVLLNGEPFPFSKKDLSLVVHTLIWATFGHAPSWVLRNPVYRSVQKRMRAHFLDLVARIRTSPERAATLVGRYLDLEPPIGRDRWEDHDLVAVPYSAYLAGFDTVASASSFLLYRLLTHPEHLAKVRREFEELSCETPGPVAPTRQKYLRAAFLEAVRLNPPGTVVIRVADRDFEFTGYTIRQGDEVLVMIASDLNPELFERPNEFDPMRYFAPQSGPLRRRVLPFGTGSHRCTGAVLGELVAVEMVSYWVNHFDLQVVPTRKTVRPVARPFTQPDGLRVEVLGRRAGGAECGESRLRPITGN